MVILQLVIILVGVLAILLMKANIIELIPPCTVRSYLGIICPTCGVTRCVTNIINFNFKMAFMYHPIFFIVIFYLLFVDLLYIVNTVFNKQILRVLYPSFKFLTIFYMLFFFQYFYRLFIMLKYGGFEFL